jgi:hypothetical protein
MFPCRKSPGMQLVMAFNAQDQGLTASFSHELLPQFGTTKNVFQLSNEMDLKVPIATTAELALLRLHSPGKLRIDGLLPGGVRNRVNGRGHQGIRWEVL